MKFTAEAITADWGEKCGEFEPECPTCVTWAFFDEIVRLRSELEDVKSSYEQEFEFLLVKLTNSSNAELVEAANEVIASASDTYKKRNGHLASFEDDGGEKCWIVPFDAFERLRAALKAEGESR